MISASNADHDDTDDWLAIMNRQRIMVPERLRGKDNGTNMFLAVSYLRPFTVISATADLLRIRARAEGNDSNIDTDQQTPRSVGCPVLRRPRHHGSTCPCEWRH